MEGNDKKKIENSCAWRLQVCTARLAAKGYGRNYILDIAIK